MTKDKSSEEQLARDLHPAFEQLDTLVGKWDIQASKDGQPLGNWQTTFEWLKEKVFLIQHIEDGPPGPEASSEWMARSPNPVTAIIGLDDTSGNLTQLYSDARGVSRVYQMSLKDNIWKMRRHAPGFSQRFKGIFGDDTNSITALWEYSKDGDSWEHDFDLRYSRL